VRRRARRAWATPRRARRGLSRSRSRSYSSRSRCRTWSSSELEHHRLRLAFALGGRRDLRRLEIELERARVFREIAARGISALQRPDFWITHQRLEIGVSLDLLPVAEALIERELELLKGPLGDARAHPHLREVVARAAPRPPLEHLRRLLDRFLELS